MQGAGQRYQAPLSCRSDSCWEVGEAAAIPADGRSAGWVAAGAPALTSRPVLAPRDVASHPLGSQGEEQQHRDRGSQAARRSHQRKKSRSWTSSHPPGNNNELSEAGNERPDSPMCSFSTGLATAGRGRGAGGRPAARMPHEEPGADRRPPLEEEAWTASDEMEAGTVGPVTSTTAEKENSGADDSRRNEH
jgi:hypothetical protein